MVNFKVGDVKVKVDINTGDISRKYMNNSKQAIRILKSEIAKDTESYVPFRDGQLRRSVTRSLSNTDPKIEYASVYARFLYYGQVMVGKISRRPWAKKGETKETINKNLTYSQGGSHWFEKSKGSNLSKWLKMAKKLFR